MLIIKSKKAMQSRTINVTYNKITNSAQTNRYTNYTFRSLLSTTDFLLKKEGDGHSDERVDLRVHCNRVQRQCDKVVE